MDRKQTVDKLLSRGAEALSDKELLTIIMDDALCAEKILRDNSLTDLAAMSASKLRPIAGMGISKAITLATALELGRRAKFKDTDNIEEICSSQDVADIFHPILASLPHEEFWVLYLNSAQKILDKVRISKGGVSSSVVDHKLIVKRAVELLAEGVIVVHNHPSGVSEPSGEDVEITEKLVQALSLFEIELLDHMIVTKNHNYSFKAQGHKPF